MWQRLIDDGIPYAIILEDDARLEDGFAAAIDSLMEIERDWDFVSLSPKQRYPADRMIALSDGERSLVRVRRRFGGLVGYLIRLEAAAVFYRWSDRLHLRVARKAS